MIDRPSGQIITFYSYKGGTGRTMALANLACLLARADPTHAQAAPPRVLIIDWDFEAPGLHRYLQPYLEPDSAKRFQQAPGCLELFQHLADKRSTYDRRNFVANRQRARSWFDALDLDPYLLATRFPGLSLIKAGLFDDDYPRRASAFDWDDLFHATVGLFAGFADFLRARFDYVLVDSRTGITDTSGICTMLLPDKLVVVFTPNQQSLTGIESLVRKAVAYRKGSPDGRPLTVFPLPSRVEMARPQLLEAWRNGASTDPSVASLLPAEMSGYQPTFERLFAQIYARSEVNLDEYFNEVMLQHIPDYAYGEPIAVALEASETRISLSRSYSAFRDRLIELDVPWSSLHAARLERDIVRRCEAITADLKKGMIDEAIKLSFALIEQKLPESLFERCANIILEVAAAAYPRSSAAASTLIRQGTELAVAEGGNIDPSTLAQVYLDAGKLSQYLGDLPLAADLLQASHERFSACFGAEHPASLMAMNQMASAARARGDIGEARALYEKELAIKRRVLGEQDPEALASMSRLAVTFRDQGDFAEARALQEQVLESCRRVLGEQHPQTIEAMRDLALTLDYAGDLAGARELQEEVLAACRRVLGEEHPQTIEAMHNLALTLRDQGDLAAARELQEEVLAACRRVLLGEEHPQTIEAMRNLALTLRYQRDFAAAQALQEQVLATCRQVFGEDHLQTLQSMHDLAVTLGHRGDLVAARVLQEQVLATFRKTLGEEHRMTLESMNNLALTLHGQGDFAAAQALQERALRTYRERFGEEHPRTLRTMASLARTLRAQDDLVRARAVQEQVLATYRQVLGEKHPDTLRSMAELNEIIRAQGSGIPGISDKVRASFEPVMKTLGRVRRDLSSVKGVVAVRPGYGYPPTGDPVPAIVVTVTPGTTPVKASELQKKFGIAFAVTDATVEEQIVATTGEDPVSLGLPDGLTASTFEKVLGSEDAIDFGPPKTGSYKNMEPTNLPLVKEAMELTICVSPECGWSELQTFLARTKNELTVAMHQFTAPYILEAVMAAVAPRERRLELVLHPIPEEALRSGASAEHLDEKRNVLRRLSEQLGKRFRWTWATLVSKTNPDGLWASAYHIKVAVRDRNAIWLSSGNWQSSSLPDLLSPGFQKEFNRDCHAIIVNDRLASIYETYIKRDYELASARAAAAELSPAPDLFVPEDEQDGPVAFSAPPQTFEPLRVNRVVSVQPLLTPDNYAENVLKLIRSATQSVWVQNQYINFRGTSDDFNEFRLLVGAVKDRIDKGLDVRIICRDTMKQESLDVLVALGFPHKVFRFQPACNNKAIIVDGKIAMFGSHTWSNEGVKTNRDASLIFHDQEIASYLAAIYEYDWNRLAAQHPRSHPRVAGVNEGAPPGFQRVPFSAVFDD